MTVAAGTGSTLADINLAALTGSRLRCCQP